MRASRKKAKEVAEEEPLYRSRPEGRPLGFSPSLPMILLAGAGLLLLVWGVYALVALLGEREPTPAPPPPAASTSPVDPALTEPVAHGATGKSVEQDQRDALAAAQALLTEAGKSPGGQDAATRMLALEEDDFTVVTPALEDGVRYPAPADAAMKAQTYQTLITLHEVLSEEGTKAITAVDGGATPVVIDSALGMAYVPLRSFTGNSTLFAFEMVYVDGGWRLAPYTLLQNVRMSALLDGLQGAPASPAPSP